MNGKDNPDVYVGKVTEDKWKRNMEKDDDEIMKKTPEDVVEMLGFDPLEEEDAVPKGITVLPDGSAFFTATVKGGKGK